MESFKFVGVNFQGLSNFYRFVGTYFRGSVGWGEVGRGVERKDNFEKVDLIRNELSFSTAVIEVTEG